MMGLILVAAAVSIGNAGQRSLEASLNEGITHYGRGEWKQALKVLRSVAPRLLVPQKRALAYFHLALVRVELKQSRAAEEDLVLALTSNPLLAVDPKEHPPRAVALFHAVRDRLEGTLMVKPSQTKTRVIVDGAPRGESAAPITLRIGRHTVRAEAVDGTAVSPEYAVVIGVGKTTELAPTLSPRDPQLTDRNRTDPRKSGMERALAESTPLELARPEAVAPKPLGAPLHVVSVPARRTRGWAYVALGTAVLALTGGSIATFGATEPGSENRAAYNAAVPGYNTRVGVGSGLIIGGAVTGVLSVVLFILHREPTLVLSPARVDAGLGGFTDGMSGADRR